MSDSDKIDMFKNDVRYRDNIAHVETIPAKTNRLRMANMSLSQPQLHPERHWPLICPYLKP